MLLPTAYLPSIAWCSDCWNAPLVYLEASEHYQKGSLRNRAFIAGPNGVQRLSIPLAKGKHQQTPIREVRISYDEAWQRQHWRSIRTSYGNAPFFEHYAEDLFHFYTQRFDFLFDFNLALLQFVLVKKMGWTGEFRFTGEYETPANPAFGSRFAPLRYPQVFEDKNGFQPDLSVLDLLFCCGKRGGEILEKSIILS